MEEERNKTNLLATATSISLFPYSFHLFMICSVVLGIRLRASHTQGQFSIELRSWPCEYPFVKLSLQIVLVEIRLHSYRPSEGATILHPAQCPLYK